MYTTVKQVPGVQLVEVAFSLQLLQRACSKGGQVTAVTVYKMCFTAAPQTLGSL